jgi:predicted metal-dependent peptidase
MAIKPIGGGGTNFSDIFRYMNMDMVNDPPSYTVIITDGYATFPEEKEANGVPVLWLINNDRVVPPWGKVARILD